MEATTIQVKRSTLERLKQHREYGRESYDEVLNDLLDTVEEDPLTPEEIDEIKKGLDDIRAGRTKTVEEVAKKHGVRL